MHDEKNQGDRADDVAGAERPTARSDYPYDLRVAVACAFQPSRLGVITSEIETARPYSSATRDDLDGQRCYQGPEGGRLLVEVYG